MNMKICALVVLAVLSLSLISAGNLLAYGVDGNIEANTEISGNVGGSQIGSSASVNSNANADSENSSTNAEGNYGIIVSTKGVVDVSGVRIGSRANLSNGRQFEIKVMPQTASETALARLRLTVCNPEECTIELKEIGSGEDIKLAYEVRAKKEAKILGLFKTRANISVNVDAETGEIIDVKKPWWATVDIN